MLVVGCVRRCRKTILEGNNCCEIVGIELPLSLGVVQEIEYSDRFSPKTEMYIIPMLKEGSSGRIVIVLEGSSFVRDQVNE